MAAGLRISRRNSMLEIDRSPDVTFSLPETMPATVTELDDLLHAAQASINVIQARHAAGDELTQDDVVELNRLLDAVDTITSAAATAATAEQEHAEQVDAALRRAEEALHPAEPETEDAEETLEAPEADTVEEPAAEEPEPAVVAGGDRRPVTFAGVGADTVIDTRREPGWEMDPGCPGYRNGMPRIGFAELAKAIDSVRGGSRTRNKPGKSVGSYSAQVLARLQRDMPIIEDGHALVAAIEEATDERKLPGGSLTAAGGWCAPSEQLYTFCDVPNASDLISLPDLTINRGGIRWPVEPDLTSIYANFEWFFTETQLEAVDSGTGDPSAQKVCVDIPCPDEFEEIRLSAVGWCVEAGILQTQGWPELITWFMQSLTQEHLRSISRRTILDMVAGSAAKTIADTTVIGTTSALLNGLALQATNLRLNRGLPRNATIEGVAPSWLAEVMRADVAMMEGTDTKNVTDAQVSGWFAARNIALQFVGDWQTRGTNEPGNLGTLTWPATAKVLLYPAGTWFRSLSPVIELGVMYPKEQLQVNRYTRFFTEDAIAVGKRCNASLVVEVPICVSGGYGAPVTIACETP